jgi:hypothetical protein
MLFSKKVLRTFLTLNLTEELEEGVDIINPQKKKKQEKYISKKMKKKSKEEKKLEQDLKKAEAQENREELKRIVHSFDSYFFSFLYLIVFITFLIYLNGYSNAKF